MTAVRQRVGILATMILAPAVVWGQVGTVAVQDVSVSTNVPALAPVPVPQAPVAVEPVQPTVVEPRPAEVIIPAATAPRLALSETISPTRATPLRIPTTQDLLTKSMTSVPGGSQQKLNAITSSALTLSPTNEAAQTAGSAATSSSSTNWPANQPTPWQKNNPLLNGVDYHW